MTITGSNEPQTFHFSKQQMNGFYFKSKNQDNHIFLFETAIKFCGFSYFPSNILIIFLILMMFLPESHKNINFYSGIPIVSFRIFSMDLGFFQGIFMFPFNVQAFIRLEKLSPLEVRYNEIYSFTFHSNAMEKGMIRYNNLYCSRKCS